MGKSCPFGLLCVIFAICLFVIIAHFGNGTRLDFRNFDLSILFPLNILRMNRRNFMKFGIHIIIEKSRGIVACHFSQICNPLLI